MIQVLVNSIIEWVGEGTNDPILQRVLWIDVLKDTVILIDVMDSTALPMMKELSVIDQALTEGRAIKRTIDPFARMVIEENIPPPHKEKRDWNWGIIENLVQDEPDVYDPDLRGVMIREASEKYSVTKKVFYRNLRRFWQGGKTKNALIPRYEQSGAPGLERLEMDGEKRGRRSRLSKEDPEKSGVNVNAEIRQIFRVAVQLYYNKKDKFPLRHCYQKMLEKHFHVGFEKEGNVEIPVLPPATELPTFPQFKYWFYKEQDLKRTLIAREGSKRFALKHRAILGSSTQMAIGPGSIYQFDATVADVYLVNSLDRTKNHRKTCRLYSN
jgi:putative transposase